MAVALAIAFVPLPDLGSLLGAADSPAVDADAQRVYWEDLQPGMCSAKFQSEWTTSWSIVVPSTRTRSCHAAP